MIEANVLRWYDHSHTENSSGIKEIHIGECIQWIDEEKEEVWKAVNICDLG